MSGVSTMTWLARMTKIVTAGRLDPEIPEDDLELGDDEIEDEAGNHLHHDQDQDQVGESRQQVGMRRPSRPPRGRRIAERTRQEPGIAADPDEEPGIGRQDAGDAFRASGRGTPESSSLASVSAQRRYRPPHDSANASTAGPSGTPRSAAIARMSSRAS